MDKERILHEVKHLYLFRCLNNYDVIWTKRFDKSLMPLIYFQDNNSFTVRLTPERGSKLLIKLDIQKIPFWASPGAT